MDDLRLLLKVGANLNTLAEGKAALSNAVCAGSLPAVEMLIEEGASLQRGGEVKHFEGFTALHHACFEVRPDIVRFLVSRGADVNAKDKSGRTALSCAALKGPLGVFLDLLSGGADLEKSVFDSATALHLAAAGNQKEIAEKLIDDGMMDVDSRTDDGSTPLFFTAHISDDLYHISDSDTVAELLLAHGAEVNVRNVRRWGNHSPPRSTCGCCEGSTACSKSVRTRCRCKMPNGTDPVDEHCGYCELEDSWGPSGDRQRRLCRNAPFSWRRRECEKCGRGNPSALCSPLGLYESTAACS
mmetsp:Transcript_4646/g.9339  ORF Transcript_4646/g.9339 Transcript_4646/m.9339 type:complete len:299 (+) Transcript_4646:555-1451(+)